MTDPTPVTSSAAPPSRPSSPDVPGWGADLDRAKRPAVPKERPAPRLPAHAQRQPSPQGSSVEVLHSIERPGLTPVFGTSVPPSGLSGHLRRWAFGFSENDLRHWLLLLLADRVNVAEGLGQDLIQGHGPRLLAELGWRTEWQYNRRALWRRLLTASALVALALLAWQARRPARAAGLPPPRR